MCNKFNGFPTVFCDIDGVLLKHTNDGDGYSFESEPTEGAVEKLKEWYNLGYCIVLTSARPEYARRETMGQLARHNIHWDQLILGIGSGKRWVVNDTKRHTNDTAEAIIVERNKGLKQIKEIK